MTEKEQKLIESVSIISEHCGECDKNCTGCLLKFSNVCILKGTKPSYWKDALQKVLERKNRYAKN